jgi:hypothetical protein
MSYCKNISNCERIRKLLLKLTLQLSIVAFAVTCSTVDYYKNTANY